MSLDKKKPSSAARKAPTQRVDRVLDGLLEISNLVGSVMMVDDIMDRIVKIAARMMKVPVCSIYLFDEDGYLVLRSNVGLEKQLKGRAKFALGEGIQGWVAQTGQSVALEDANDDPRYLPMLSKRELESRALLCVPLRIQEEIVGVMSVRKIEHYSFTRDDQKFFETVCKHVAIVIEKARMYREKIEAERLAAIGVSLSGVAHYIKNVLLTMQGGEYLLEQSLDDCECPRTKQGWELLKRANRKIRGLVENMLNYCRKSELELCRTDVNKMICALADALADRARSLDIELITDLDEKLPIVHADGEALYDALLNLAGNGLDAMSEHDAPRRLTLRSQRLKGRDQICIEVFDTGPGVPEENREKIFNLFFSTKGKQGTGIGLAATRKIVEDHGGTIELAPSDPEGDLGAVFRLFLPVKPTTARG